MDSDEDKYVLWNYMLAEQCLAKSHDGTVLLTVTPGILAMVYQEADEGSLSPEEAEAALVSAVANVYRKRVLESPLRLRALKSPVSDTDVPFCLGFLALTVLAAFNMRTDDERTGRAFYPRLAEMLGCNLVRGYPAGFDTAALVELWTDLADWLQSHYGRKLAQPIGAQRYLAHAFGHVPLRQVDIDRLPAFFTSHGYEAGARAPLDRLGHDLVNANGPWRGFTESGQQALVDPNRCQFVVQQIADELERWDGSHTDAAGVRIANIEIWMDIQRRRVRLFLLARRPSGFPERIANGALVFETSQEGWYDPVELGPNDGQLIRQGFRVDSLDRRFALSLRPSEVIALTPSDEFAGFVSDSVLRSETQNAVLCAEDRVVEVADYLASLGRSRSQPYRDQNLPMGWMLFTDVRPSTTDRRPPSGLERLGIETSIALIAKGGLRLGRRWTWLQSMPANLTIIGAHQGVVATIDGIAAEVDTSGVIRSDLLEEPGIHVVEIGNRLRQRIAVLAAAVSPECETWDCSSSPPVAIPGGNWVLTGDAPGEYESVKAPREGMLSRPKFPVRWAIRVGAGRGAVAVHIHDGGAFGEALDLRARKRGGHYWTETIYQAGIRKPRLECPSGCTQAELNISWRAYKQMARATKRQSRRRT